MLQSGREQGLLGSGLLKVPLACLLSEQPLRVVLGTGLCLEGFGPLLARRSNPAEANRVLLTTDRNFPELAGPVADELEVAARTGGRAGRISRGQRVRFDGVRRFVRV